MMNLELYTEVALNQDIAKYNLKTGDIATLVDFVEHLQGGEKGCVLEIFNAVGESIGVVTIPRSAIKPLESNEILTTRSLK
jgi:hypothetical protein